MNILQRLQNIFTTSTKHNPIGHQLAMVDMAPTQPMGMRELLHEGYRMNVVAYGCIVKVARAVAALPIEVVIPGNDDTVDVVSQHPLIELMSRPNAGQSLYDFMFLAAVYQQLYGNTYIARPLAAAGRRQLPKDIWLLQPDAVSVKMGPIGLPSEYVHEIAGQRHTFTRDAVTGESDICHVYEPDPAKPWFGMSRLQAAGLAVDLHNHGYIWNKSLLKNGARPMGALTSDQSLDDKQREEIRAALSSKHEGSANAGRTLVLGGGDIKWQSFADNNKDMEFPTVMSSAERAIALALGVPFPLVSPDAATFANMDAAKLALYEDTVLPLANTILAGISRWLEPRLDRKAYLRVDDDNVSALEPRRQAKYTRTNTLVGSGVITRNEARRAVGYDEVEGGDTLLVPTGLMPVGMAGEDLFAATPAVGTPTSNADETAKTLALLGYDAKDFAELGLDAPAGSGGLTNFPCQGDNEPVELHSSRYKQFDYQLALRLKRDYPTIWAKANKGNAEQAFAMLTKLHGGKPDERTNAFLRAREIWATRNAEKHDIASVVAQVKWGVVNTQGQKAMLAMLQDYMGRVSAAKGLGVMAEGLSHPATLARVGDFVSWVEKGQKHHGRVLTMASTDSFTVRQYKFNEANGQWEVTLDTHRVPALGLKLVEDLV